MKLCTIVEANDRPSLNLAFPTKWYEQESTLCNIMTPSFIYSNVREHLYGKLFKHLWGTL
jgi:hypothetical protein